MSAGAVRVIVESGENQWALCFHFYSYTQASTRSSSFKAATRCALIRHFDVTLCLIWSRNLCLCKYWFMHWLRGFLFHSNGNSQFLQLQIYYTLYTFCPFYLKFCWSVRWIGGEFFAVLWHFCALFEAENPQKGEKSVFNIFNVFNIATFFRVALMRNKQT